MKTGLLSVSASQFGSMGLSGMEMPSFRLWTWQLTIASAALLSCAFLPGAVAAAASEQPLPPECRYVEAGPPGASGNELLIERNESLGVRRQGDSIDIFKRSGLGSEIPCEGRQATIDSIDRIVYRPPGGGHELVVDESGGRLAPGATPEPGGDEIEIFSDFPRAHGYIHSGVRVLGSPGPDRMRIGSLGHDRTGINLDVGHDGSHPDADVISSAVSPGHYTLDGRAGDDRLGSSGRGPEFSGPLPEGSVVLRGGEGNDLIFGGRRVDIIRGEHGDDVIYGRGGDDRIDPGPGADRVFAAAGADAISSAAAGDRDGAPDFYSGGSGDDSIRALNDNPDRIVCGAGIDNLWIDPIDEWSSATCEKPHGPGTQRNPARAQNRARASACASRAKGSFRPNRTPPRARITS